MKLATRILHRLDWKMTSPFGNRIHPITRKPDFHKGIDIWTKGEKWPQYALEKGTVVSCGRDWSIFGFGAIFAWIVYPRLGLKILHYHLDSLSVKKGQEVDENTVIGLTGKTGRATGIHLHLGVRSLTTNEYVDPDTINYMIEDTQIRKGDYVLIVGKFYATGEDVPDTIKERTHTVDIIYGVKARLQPINSWVYLKDLKKV